MKIAMAMAVACLSVAGLATANDAQAVMRHYELNIPKQSLNTALRDFAQQTGLRIALFSDTIDGNAVVGPILGVQSAEDALKTMLAPSGLSYKVVNDKTIAVMKPGAAASASSSAFQGAGRGEDWKMADSSSQPSPQSGEGAQGADEAGKSLDSKESKEELTEIVVTAQKKKKEERLQDVPIPVTAIDPSALAESDKSRLQDYFAAIPGLNVAPVSAGQQAVVIRGVTTGAVGNPTVGTTIDDVPYGSSTLLGLGQALFPDLDPSDLARIEVLRGPQGSLYGSSSLGGLIKFVTRDPSTAEFSGRAQVLGNDVEHGQAGYGLRAAVNVPLSGAFAFRASGFTRRDPGYVDNVTTGQANVNRANADGGHFTALWRLSEALSFKFSALLQHIDSDGSDDVDTNNFLQPVYGTFKQAHPPATQGYNSDVRLYTAALSAKLGSLDFFAISGYGINKYSQLYDVTQFLGPLAEFGVPGTGFDGFGVSGAVAKNDYDTKKFTQEFRLSSAAGKTLEWLLGAFYTHEDTVANQPFYAIDPSNGSRAGTLIDFNFPTTLSELAAFGDLTIHFTDRFDTQFGGREAQFRQVYNETDTGAATIAFFGSPPPFENPPEHTKGTAFTYLVTPRFKISPDLMVYTRLASGYRVGGNNVNAVAIGIPTRYAPDKTNNYEIGIKGNLFERALTLDASVYYVDWKDIQISIINGFAYNVNAGRAKSQGVELAVEARPLTGLTLSSWIAYNDAKLTQDLPPSSTAFGSSGDRLPYSGRVSGNISADQNIVLTGNWAGFAGATLSYVGDRVGEFSGSAALPRQRFPGYADIDLRLGARSDTWTFNLFVNNIADRRGIASRYGAYTFYIHPRTAGLSVSKTF